MNGMPFDMILAQPLAETFMVSGIAPNVLAAHTLAWEGLEQYLSTDPLAAWQLKVMQHVLSTQPPGVAFQAEFARNPEYDAGGDA